MNFWTFLDRNGVGVVIAIFIVCMFGGLSIDSCAKHVKDLKCTEARPT